VLCSDDDIAGTARGERVEPRARGSPFDRLRTRRLPALAAAASPMRVKFERVSKRFGAHHAVRDIDLEVVDGECLVLLGPSGCGKTTLLRLLAGLESIDAGAIWIGDRRVNDVAPADRDVAMVFQNYALYPHFSVFDNIAFPLRTRGVATAEIDRRVREAADRVGLGDLLARKPAQLSGGQQQRVALARAIVRQPAVYLMDEPLSNLDAQLRLQTRAELKRLHRELGTTTVYVTHDQAEAMTLGSRIAIMRHGSIVQAGSPMELYREPANTFVATFLGSPSMNLLDDRTNGTRATLGIRPEDIEVATAPVDGADQAQAIVVERLGNETLVTFDYRGQHLVARVAGDRSFEAGQAAWVRLPPERVLRFDASSGRKL
jgi:ABC-type sugar transport system ATPase subunit